jgi:hypothetical protein
MERCVFERIAGRVEMRKSERNGLESQCGRVSGVQGEIFNACNKTKEALQHWIPAILLSKHLLALSHEIRAI